MAYDSNTFSSPTGAFTGLGDLLPSLTQLLGFAPQPYQSFGNTPYVDPAQMPGTSAAGAQMNAALVDPANAQSFLNQFEQQTQTALAPEFQREQQGLDESMAQRGLFNSSAANQYEQDLQKQQGSTLAAQLQPLIGQAMGFSQENALTNQGAQQQAGLENANLAQQNSQFNANLNQGANQWNAQAQNDAAAANAGLYGQITNSNMNQYNAYLASLLQYGMGLGNSMMGSFLSSFGADPSAISILGQGAAGAGNAYGNAYAGSLANSGNLLSGIASAFNKSGAPSTQAPMGGGQTGPGAYLGASYAYGNGDPNAP